MEILNPKSEQEWLALRTKDITSTEISALFGLSPYLTKFELWHRKKNNTGLAFESNDRVKWGLRLQDSIAAGLAEDNKWTVRRMDEYIRNPKLRIGSSFDFGVIESTARSENSNISDMIEGLLEIKNVDALIFKEGWAINDDGTIEAPAHIEIQVQHQLLVSERSFAFIGSFIGGNRIEIIKRIPDQQIFEAIIKEAELFWKSIDENNPPAPDFKADAKFISKLYGYAEPGSVFDARGNESFAELCKKHKEYGDAEKEAAEKKEAIKAELLTKIGNAEKVLGDGFSSITCGSVGPAEISYTREGYRMFRINWPRKKKE